MRVIIGTESFAPSVSGVSIFAERIAGFLSENGHDVYIFVPSPNAKTYWDKKYAKFKVFRIGSIANPFRKSHRLTLFPRAAIEKEFLKIKPDIVHIQDPASISSALQKIANYQSVPVIVTNHFSLDFIFSYLKLFRWFHPIIKKYLMRRFARFYNRCVLITTPSETAKGKIVDWGFKTPIQVLSNGIDVVRFHPSSDKNAARAKFKLPGEDPIIIYSGRIDKDKSVGVLVRAIPLVLKKINARFLFVGGGQMVDELKQLAAELGIENNVTFLGWLDQKSSEYPLAYQSADIFASPSCIETQSIVMLEALATGLPIVAAAAGSFPEFIRDGENGYLCRPSDSKEMARKIVDILSDGKLKIKMSGNALALAKKHEVNSCMKRFEETYGEIIKHRLDPTVNDEVVLVDKDDNQVGTKGKIPAHQDGDLHRCFSIFIFNSMGELLLQKRANGKYHSGGLWTNTCCSHPRPNENIIDAGHRKLQQEMGFDCDLEEKFAFIYEARLGKFMEYEYDHVLFGSYDGKPDPNLEEAENWQWMRLDDLEDDIRKNPNNYTEWFKIALPKVISRVTRNA